MEFLIIMIRLFAMTMLLINLQGEVTRILAVGVASPRLRVGAIRNLPQPPWEYRNPQFGVIIDIEYKNASG